jgi:nitrite reductase (NADH) small subunit
LAVCAVEGYYYAVNGKCPHRGGRLTEGEIAGELIVCPLHHFKFNLKTGRCVMPKHLRLSSYSVKVDGDALKIELKDAIVPAAGDTDPAGSPDPPASD